MHIQTIALMFVALSGLCVMVDGIFVLLLLKRLRDVMYRYDRNLNATFTLDGFGDAKFDAFFRIARKHEEAERLVSEWILNSLETRSSLFRELFRPPLYWLVIGTALADTGVFLSEWLSRCAVPVLCLSLLTFWHAALLSHSSWRKLGAFAEKLDAQYALWECSLPSEPGAAGEGEKS
ncbi:MAG: hypothetical protein NUW08_03025 [Candidatus Uhrbacteria bacterium]|nr:hypothetical protein [Candidatus Uhrbacteria bacterium]